MRVGLWTFNAFYSQEYTRMNLISGAGAVRGVAEAVLSSMHTNLAIDHFGVV